MANKVVFSLDGRYNYRIRTDSIMGENKTVPQKDIAKVIDMDCKFILTASISEIDKQKMYKQLFKQLTYNYNLAVKSNLKIADEVCKQIEEVLYKNRSLWKKSKYISFQRKLGYYLISGYPVLYKKVYRLYSYSTRRKSNE